MEKDHTLILYKLFLLSWFSIYMWGPAWDSMFRGFVYAILFFALGGGVVGDVYLWQTGRAKKKQEIASLVD